jgi:hypothetical protein
MGGATVALQPEFQVNAAATLSILPRNRRQVSPAKPFRPGHQWQKAQT